MEFEVGWWVYPRPHVYVYHRYGGAKERLPANMSLEFNYEEKLLYLTSFGILIRLTQSTEVE